MSKEKNEKLTNDIEKTSEKASGDTEKPIKAKIRKKPVFKSDELITVYNGYYGTLNITLKKSGYDIVLSKFGDDAEIEFGELKILRNEHKAFYEKNWIVINDVDVLEALDVKHYYDKSLDISGLDELLNLEDNEISEKIKSLNEGQKLIVTYMVTDKISTGEIDSRKTISALEEALGVELIER